MNDQKTQNHAFARSRSNAGLGVATMTTIKYRRVAMVRAGSLSSPQRGIYFFCGDRSFLFRNRESEEDTSGRLSGGYWRGFWQYLQFLKGLDPETRRDIISLKFCILRLKFSNFRLECSNFLLQRRILKLERKHGLTHDAPLLNDAAECVEHEIPNVNITGTP